MDAPKFSPSDRNSPLWRALTNYYTARLQTLRAQNDALSKTPEETAALRGRIAECKAFLALADDKPSL